MFVVLEGDVPVGAIAYNGIDARRRVELDVWMSAEANCGRGLGTDAIEVPCDHPDSVLMIREAGRSG